MAECKEIVGLLSDYVNRELPAKTCSVLDAHLQSCATCREAATELQRTVALCRRFRAEDVPGPLAAERRDELLAVFRKVLHGMQEGRRAD
jgi:anti-sigma factor RsiW